MLVARNAVASRCGRGLRFAPVQRRSLATVSAHKQRAWVLRRLSERLSSADFRDLLMKKKAIVPKGRLSSLSSSECLHALEEYAQKKKNQTLPVEDLFREIPFTHLLKNTFELLVSATKYAPRVAQLLYDLHKIFGGAFLKVNGVKMVYLHVMKMAAEEEAEGLRVLLPELWQHIVKNIPEASSALWGARAVYAITREKNVELGFDLLKEMLTYPVQKQADAFVRVGISLFKRNDKVNFIRLIELAQQNNVKPPDSLFSVWLSMAKTLAEGLHIAAERDKQHPDEKVDISFPLALLALAGQEKNVVEARKILETYESRVLFARSSDSFVRREFAKHFPDAEVEFRATATEETIPNFLNFKYRRGEYKDVWELYVYSRDKSDLFRHDRGNEQTLVMITTAMGSAGYMTDKEKFFEVYRDWINYTEKFPFLPRDATISVATDAMGRMQLIPELFALWKNLLEKSFYPNANCWLSFIEALARNGKYDEAFQIAIKFMRDVKWDQSESTVADPTVRRPPPGSY